MSRIFICSFALSLGVRTNFPLEKASSLLHVTRLFRHEHAGDEALVESEARWFKEDTAAVQTSVELPKVAQFSAKQVSWLEQHHRAKDQTGMRTEQVHRRATRSLLQHARQGKQDDDAAAILLTSANSEYLGPVGVGTILKGQCNDNQDLASVPFLGSASLLEGDAKTAACHTESQTQLNMVWDTGSTNIWANSDLCTTGSCAETARSRLDHTVSLTYVPPEDPLSRLRITFGTGGITGMLAGEDFHVGSYTVNAQSFGMIQEAEGGAFDSTAFEGIMGLAFPNMSASGTPFFDNMIQQQVLKQNLFAFYFSLDNPSANALLFGGVDQRFHDGSLTWFPVTQPHYWALDLLSFRIGDEEMLGTATMPSLVQQRTPKAIVDSGTTYITAEAGLYQEIMDKLSIADCSQMSAETHPDVHFHLQSADGPVDYVLDRNQYMVGSSGGTCLPAFMQVDLDAAHGPAMILGDVFMRYYFTVHDRGDGKPENARVGFAVARHGPVVESMIKELTSKQPSFKPKNM